MLSHLSRKSAILLKSSMVQPRVVIAVADATGREYRGVDRDCVAIKRDGRSLTDLFTLGSQSVWTKIPEHQVIVSSATGELCPLAIKAFAKVPALDATAWSFHKFRCVHVQQLRSQGSELLVVRSTL